LPFTEKNDVVTCSNYFSINQTNVLADCLTVAWCIQEPPTNTALLQHPLVTSTPHLGASTVDAQTRVAVEIAQQFIAFTRQTSLTGAVCIVIVIRQYLLTARETVE